MEKTPLKPTHFPNLDGLRFIGSLIIILLHVEGIKKLHSIPTNSIFRHYSLLGNMDVSLFFVLSGFLIIYLLLKEKKETGTINLKAYYTRRTLRIWPLYYLILILGFFVLPHLGAYFGNITSTNSYKQFWLCFTSFLFLPPALIAGKRLPYTLGPTWSVRVEELFYLCLPILLLKTKKYLISFIVIVIILLLIRNLIFVGNGIFNLGLSYKLIRFLIQYRVGCMIIGGIGAYIVVFEKKEILAFLYRKDFQWTIYILTTVLLLLRVGIKSSAEENFPSIYYEIYSILFAIIIVNLATNPQSVIRLDYKWMNYLGKISYGLYLYNSIMRIFSLELTEYLFKRDVSGWEMNVCLYFFTLLFTIVVSILSYEFFEKRFLKLKKRVTA
jgi:peptidoglycan/LPS O-acetylase OafA/YrhL